jgi:hypothetical protein
MVGTVDFYGTTLFQVVTVYFYRIYSTFGTAEQRNSSFETPDVEKIYIAMAIVLLLLFYCSKVVNKI